MDSCTDYINSGVDISDPNGDLSFRKQAETALQGGLELKVQQQIAELEQANERLRKSDQPFRAIFEGAAIGIDIFDPNGKFIEVNQKFCNILGYSWSELEGHSCLDLTHPDDIQLTLDNLEYICSGKGWSCSFEKRFIHKQGNIVWTNLTVSPLPEPSGEINHLIAVVEDITARKQTEEALQTSERKLKAFLNNIPDIAWIKDKDQRYIAVNEELGRVFGVKPEDVVGKNDFKICHPHLAEKFRNDTLDVMRSREQKSFETKIVDSKNNIRWFESIKNPIYDSQGKVIGTVGIARDITERKRIEVELRTSQEKYKTLFEILPIGVCITDNLGDIIEANLASKQILGLSGNSKINYEYEEKGLQFIGKNGKIMESSELTCVRALREKRTIKEQETLIVNSNGESTWVSISAAPIPLSNYGVAIAYVDITDRKKAEHMKDEFLAITSHELRTPLTSLMGALGLLGTGQLGALTEQGQKLLDFALLDTERLMRMVKNLLDLQSLKFSKNAIKSRNCEITDLVDRAITLIGPIAEKTGINLSVTTITGTIWADGDRILQVLTNLLENAIKFSPPQTTICLSAQQQENQILFKLKDRGRGIPSDKIESIFAPFEQVDVSDSRSRKGTGLGLAICRSIVEQHQGHIWVESTLGMGSTFCFTLPLGNKK
ncbi:PAS domain S-box protein [Limnofasciculus baicalensis]|uniref:histidine kinase n=1 Tax=Limnofasciculus baicalensis BBK-W-15 TaxID=2699891 RepID=A0AAE3GNU4_9CYAN|nr:PAS domain S-box protein [Limnofasciculus baicalensis]MCP2727053.1 PAS domain S-box protein [Limnofasciculus baicalensis BBK-W-15]